MALVVNLNPKTLLTSLRNSGCIPPAVGFRGHGHWWIIAIRGVVLILPLWPEIMNGYWQYHDWWLTISHYKSCNDSSWWLMIWLMLMMDGGSWWLMIDNDVSKTRYDHWTVALAILRQQVGKLQTPKCLISRKIIMLVGAKHEPPPVFVARCLCFFRCKMAPRYSMVLEYV